VGEIVSMMDSFIDFTTNHLYVNSARYPLAHNTNRHGILHGAFGDVEYGKPINFYKAIVRYRSFLEGLSLAAATINLHLSAIRRLADEAAESGWLSAELAIGIRRVKGVKRLGRGSGNWLTADQAQELLNAVSQGTSRGRRDAAMIGLLIGCGLRRSETVKLRLDQLELRESHWVIVDMVGKGGRLRTIPVPTWCKGLIDAWLHDG
jgi:site-specific recombinase XerC